ncbi:hypothetical protein A6J88_08565 [Neisseria mucosa]|uniref:Uncharacterized protein n=1 Tax=Neisseria mucosa TaxID=488 RepID=A0ABM6JCP6_NEIMU|nr:hypothetical protein A6J88_08565 [Neisseria mucosa]
MIGDRNSRKPVLGFWLLGEKEFCKGLYIINTAKNRHRSNNKMKNRYRPSEKTACKNGNQ